MTVFHLRKFTVNNLGLSAGIPSGIPTIQQPPAFVLGQHGVSVLMAVASLRCGRTNPNLSAGPSLRRERPSRQYLSGVWASCISPNGLLLLSINAAQGPEGYHACRDLFITPDGARRMQTAHSESHSRRSGIIPDHILEV